MAFLGTELTIEVFVNGEKLGTRVVVEAQLYQIPQVREAAHEELRAKLGRLIVERLDPTIHVA